MFYLVESSKRCKFAQKEQMTLHIFNPDHDIALASGLANFTAPHAGRQLRHDLGFLPAIWAEDGDLILVNDVEQAKRTWHKTVFRAKELMGFNKPTSPTFVDNKLSTCSARTDDINPWGWNAALRAELIRWGINESKVPTQLQLEDIRQLSHRRTATQLLPQLKTLKTVGEAFECSTAIQVVRLQKQYGQVVIKAPWSSSGRGLRFCNSLQRSDGGKAANDLDWVDNVITRQGSVIVEPYYHKVKDFGMEFYSDGLGTVTYLGLSVFHTVNGAYMGNILATEATKREMISRYIPLQLIDSIQERIVHLLGNVYKDRYCGPFGVDMMVVAGSLLHPCVEINLRRTMGHVALSLSPKDDDIRRVMRIVYSENHYQLKIERI